MNVKKIIASVLVLLGFSTYAWMEKTKVQNQDNTNSNQKNSIATNNTVSSTRAGGNAGNVFPGKGISQEVLYGEYEREDDEDDEYRPNVVTSATPQVAVGTPVISTKPTVVTPPTQNTLGAYKNGTYVGDSIDVYYGNVQVQATVQGGKITDVSFLSYPNDRQRSLAIANKAMPILTQEAISIQGSQVDTVSGATATSSGFVQSLSSALAKAK